MQYTVKSILRCVHVLLAVVLTGCSAHKLSFQGHESVVQTAKIGPGVNLNDSAAVLRVLYQHHSDWKGVPYRLGGMSKKGTDCSGLVNLLYRYKFGLSIPRTTTQLQHIGYGVHRRDLRPGDLVFFSGYGLKSHVGVYLEKTLFLHASLSKGVMLSRLNDPYWKKRYKLARRVRMYSN